MSLVSPFPLKSLSGEAGTRTCFALIELKAEEEWADSDGSRSPKAVHQNAFMGLKDLVITLALAFAGEEGGDGLFCEFFSEDVHGLNDDSHGRFLSY